MAILAAFNCEEIEIIGITSLFGNVPVHMATENSLILRDMMTQKEASAASIPVCQGSSTSFLGVEKHRIADFVHGQDGFGNKSPPKSTVCALENRTRVPLAVVSELQVENARSTPQC